MSWVVGSGLAMGSVVVVSACGPVDVEDGVTNGTGSTSVAQEFPETGGTTGEADVASSGGTSWGGTAPETGGTSGVECEVPAPPQTYLCAGGIWEDDLAGAAALLLRPEPAPYACQYDSYWYPWDYYYYGYYGYYGGIGGASGLGGEGGMGFGGQAGGTGIGGGSVGGGGPIDPGVRSDWCDGVRRGQNLSGITFAVGACQLTEVALPIEITEPGYGLYEVSIYAGDSPCDRGELVLKTAGLGTGLPIRLSPKVGDAKFLSVEFSSESAWDELELRLVDRPAVGD